MSEPTERYEVFKLYGLKSDVNMMARHIHHELDNYKMDMSPELIETLEELEKAMRVASTKMKKM